MRKLYLLFILLFTFAQISFGQDAWINELHYLNNGSDLNEFIEIAVQDNILDISLLTVTLYKAANGKLEDAIIISQLLPAGSSTNNISLYTWNSISLGNKVGICLDYSGAVLQFLSYGGSFTASDGVAEGETTIDIVLEETNATPVGSSLGLEGTYPSFAWTTYISNATPGNENFAQALPVELTSFTATELAKGVKLNWQTATEVNNYGFDVEKKAAISWEKIGFVDGHGNSNSPNDYSFVDSSPAIGEVSYRLKQIDTDGTFEYSEVVTVTSTNFAKYELYQNHPNPFNPSTVISFSLPEVSIVRLTVYNAIGQKVMELVNEQMDEGNHTVNFDGSNLSTGFYFYRLETPNYSKTMKMILLR